MSKTTKNFSYLSIGQIIATGFHALFYFVFAALLEPEIYGQMSYWIAIAGIVSLISRIGMPYSVTVFQAKENYTFVQQANILIVITSGIGSIFLLFIEPYAALLSLGFSFFFMNQYNLLGLKQYKKLAITIIVRSILFISLPLVFYFYMDFIGIILGLAIANLIGSISYFKLLRFKLLRFKINSFSELIKNSKVIIHNFGVESSTTLPTVIDKLIIVHLLGFTVTGIYQFNIQILIGLAVIPQLLHGFVLSEESSGNISPKLLKLVFLVSVLVVIISVVSMSFLVDSLFPKYVDGVISLQIIVISLIPLSLASVFTARLQSQESTLVGYSLIIRIGTLVVLLIFLGSWLNLEGLSLAVLISTSCYAGFLYYLYRKITF